MLTLHNKDFTTKYGTINTTIEAFVEEERNGLFELSFIMLNTDSLFNYVKEDNIVVANANDTLLNQKFRIYMTRKLMNNRVEVFARHISFDLMYDYIDSVKFENQSCEYVLNMLFRSSQFSTHYRGYSDIINAQDYSMSMANILEAIGGKEGSIIDTFGTGAELLRDNENIHVLNKRGHNNSVTIEYKKNLTGFELEEDTTDLVTRILPYAKYNDEENGEVIIKANYVDSPLIANYSHPFVKAIDYSDKFDDENIPTVDKLRALAELEYKNNKVDKPKQNFKIEFIPLSKCVGYEGLEDNINLCDTVTILDTRYNINTQAKVIKVIYNVLKNRYESMELGEPKTSLGDIIGNNDSTKGEKGDKGDKGEPGKDGSIGDFPNSLPSTPIVTAKVYGFANIEISWTFENKVYYQYEVYASKEADFVPNTFNLIHQGQTSTYTYQAKPNETWYFKVCCINSHGERTDFGASYATTSKVDNLSNYVSEMAIDEALIGTLSLDRGWVGELKGNYIDAKQLSVTDGNGKRTLDIDSFGNVNLDVTSLRIKSNNVAINNDIKEAIESERNNINKSIKDEITDIENSLGSVLDYIDNAFKDNIIDENEKSSINERIMQLQKEKVDIDAQIWQLKNYEELVNTNELADLISCENNFNTCFNSYIEYLRNIINAEIQEPVPPVINQEAKMHFIATDHEGACTLIQTSNGKNILIDANEKVTASQIINYLKSINVNKLDMIIITHYHSDHVGAMPAIMDYATCNGINVYHRQPDWSKMGDKEINEWLTKWYYDEFISKCNAKGINLITPTEKFKISLGENEYIEFYNTNNQDYSNYNSLSFGLLYVLGESKCFLAGDMTYNSENLLGKNVIGQVDLHKTGHHGWNYSTQEWFAKELNAKYNILEALKINDETRRNARSVLQKNNLPIYSLASNGTIIATIKPSGVSLNKNTTDVLRDIWWQNQETNDWYWWKNNGQLAKSETLNLGGKNYNFDSEGICLNPY